MRGDLTLKQANKWRSLARKFRVSSVARSPRGFMTAYARAKTLSKLSPYWKNRRKNFIKRHYAQVKKRKEPLFKKGVPTRRHLALIMWAWSPVKGKLR